MKILIGTKNPGKIEGANKAFSRYFQDVEITGIAVSSDVSEQPLNDEIFLGAKNRIKNLKEFAKENKVYADFFVAIESGITNKLGRWMIVNIAVIEDNKKFESFGMSPGFPVPQKYVEDIIKTELGVVLDKIFEKTDMAKGKGGINSLTHEEISRIDLTEYAFIMALTKYINGALWSD